jgi:hypothetical protein
MVISLNETLGNDHENLLSSTIKLLPLYGVYVFLSGWASLDSYYRFFGMDPKSLDIGLYDTLLKGFTILFPVRHLPISWLFCGVLWSVYGFVILAPIAAKHFARHQRAWGIKADLVWVTLLVVSLMSVFSASFKAGEDRARLDKTEQTTLPTIMFQVRNSGSPTGTQESATKGLSTNTELTYYGKLLLLRNGTYFIHGVKTNGESSAGSFQLSLYRAEDLKEVSVVEHQ